GLKKACGIVSAPFGGDCDAFFRKLDYVSPRRSVLEPLAPLTDTHPLAVHVRRRRLRLPVPGPHPHLRPGPHPPHVQKDAVAPVDLLRAHVRRLAPLVEQRPRAGDPARSAATRRSEGAPSRRAGARRRPGGTSAAVGARARRRPAPLVVRARAQVAEKRSARPCGRCARARRARLT
ncbi:uncharacterized protein RHOBADRAFT_66070, partial [Rhodotorula graminis WP1]